MLLVIFGAGASYDSVPHLRASLPSVPPEQRTSVEQDRPPLANQLFENRPKFVDAMERFRDCIPLVPLLRKPDIAVEQELAKFQEQAKHYAVMHRRLAAILYYLHFALWDCQQRWYRHHRGITNYATLIHAIDRWRSELGEQVCFVTFNYDTMLEQALLQVLGLNTDEMDGYISWENYTLIKLHGSVNWGRRVLNIAPDAVHTFNYERLIRDIGQLEISDSYELTDEYPMATGSERDHLVFPALSIPVDKKDEFSCPDAHVEKLASIVPSVTKILTIGWRATEAKFLNMLQSSLTGLKGKQELMVVSGTREGVQETFKNLTRSAVRSSNHALVETGFTALIMEYLDLLEQFLHQGIARTV